MVLWKSFERHLFEFFLIVYRVHPQYNLLYEKNLTSVLLPFTFPVLLHRAGQLETRAFYYYMTIWLLFLSLSAVSNTRFIAAVIERHTHSPERRRRYWGRSGTESDHGKSAYVCVCALLPQSLKEKRYSISETILLKRGSKKNSKAWPSKMSHLGIYWEFYYWNKAKPSPVAQCILLFGLDFIGGSRLGLHGVYSAC